jgi:hypothetical protein
MRRDGLGVRDATRGRASWAIGASAVGAPALALAVDMALALALVLGAAGGCVRARPCDGVACAATCPREAAPDGSGRCACADGDVLVLGACVPPPVAAAFCGPASATSGTPCDFRACGPAEILDAVAGACVPRGSLPHGGSIACEAPTTPILEDGRLGCVAPEVACPRGATYRALDDAGAQTGAGACMRPPACPAGTVSEGAACRPVVTRGVNAGLPRVDVGLWTTLAIGVDGGRGTPWLCRPLAQRPTLLGTSPIRISVTATFPDQDVSRLHVAVEARGTGGVGGVGAGVTTGTADATGRALAPAETAAVTSAVTTLFELLRGLGGEASAAAIAVDVTCALRPPRASAETPNP